MTSNIEDLAANLEYLSFMYVCFTFPQKITQMKCGAISKSLTFTKHISSFPAQSILFDCSEELIQGQNKEFGTHLKRMTLVPDYFGGRAMLGGQSK